MNHEEKIAYTLFVCKLVTYFLFMILNGVQVIYERKSILVYKNMLNTKFIIYLCLFLFCLTRVIHCLLFLIYPDDWRVGSWFYFFFSWGVFFVFCEWSFLGSLWIQLVYQFFVSKKMKTKSTKSINTIYYISSFLVGIYFLWSVPINIIFLMNDKIQFLEAVGMVVFVAVYALVVIINGWILIKRMKKSSKKANYIEKYKNIILRSKILVYTIIVVIIVVVIQDLIINFVLPQNPQPYINMVYSNLIMGIAETTQMIIVMYVFTMKDEGGSSFINYFLLKRIDKLSSSTNSSGSGSTTNSGNNNNNNDANSYSFENNSNIPLNITSGTITSGASSSSNDNTV